MHDEDFFTSLFWAILIALGLVLIWAMYASWKWNHEHAEFLRVNGCQVVKETETGRRVRSGKTTRAEIMTLYECSGGDRVEIDGTYAGGAIK
ncbi:hypothetical protein K6V90_09450 [Cupriavidus pauculus]|uniref:hypothetical protein n=1 Tax=Cupriavidus pauculus TaxID=82633 RepID=UPI001C933CD4|nr:hypothetical protein [Cupriavidus pauculus]MBY4730756.1 hypothetical protein [Cupriavidus pauculus]